MFAGYRIEAVVGRGAMGIIYRASESRPRRTVALKVVAEELAVDRGFRERFLRESQIAATIEHPHVIPVFQIGEEQGMLFIATRLIRGGDLAALVDSAGRLEPPRAARIVDQIADALDSAHKRGLVHRDVKPHNVLVEQLGRGEHIYLTDFGLTKDLGSRGTLTEPGALMGTIGFAAPEQLKGDPVDARADVYSLGCVLFNVLTGRPPYPRSRPEAVIYAHLDAPPPTVSDVIPGLSPRFDEIIARALAKSPGDRFPTAAELGTAVVAAAQGSGAGRPHRGDAGSQAEAPAGDREPLRRPSEPAQPLIGRADETVRLQHALARASRGDPSLTLVIGEAGIGKSRLVTEMARRAAIDGALTVSGDCVPLGGEDFQYAPLASALGEVEPSILRSALATLPAGARQELAVVFPEIAIAIDEEAVVDDAVPQSRLFHWTFALLRALTRHSTVLLIIEDAQWADRSTRDFLQFVVRKMRSERLAVVVTVRDEQPRTTEAKTDRGSTMRLILAELLRNDRVQRIDLSRLTQDGVAALLQALLGHAPSNSLVASVFTRAEGNPYFTEALVDAGKAEEPGLTPELRDVLLIPIEDLSPPARSVIQTIAVMGRPVPPGLLGDAAGLSEGELLSALREAIDRRVLVSETDTLRFRHALLGEAVYGDLHAGERSVLHAAIAAALEDGDVTPNPAELGRHREASGELRGALGAFFEAGVLNSSLSAYSEALRHFDHALELWERCRADAGHFPFDRVDILTKTAEAARWTGDAERARRLCQEALEALDESTDAARAAALYERLGRYQPWNIAASRAAYARALELLSDVATAQRARLLADDALSLSWDWRWAETKARAEQALATAVQADAPGEEASARAVLGVGVAQLGDADAGERELRLALDVVEQSGTIEASVTVRLDLADVLRLRGRTREALALMDDTERLAARHGADSYASLIAANAADDLVTLGRWPEAETRLRAIAGDHLPATARLLKAIVTGRLAMGRGDAAAAGAEFTLAQTLLRDASLSFLVALHSAAAELELWSENPDGAAIAVAEVMDAISGREDVLYSPALFSVALRAQADIAERARARSPTGRAVGSATQAKSILRKLEGLASRAAGSGASLHIVDLHLALALAELSRLQGRSAGGRWTRAAMLGQKSEQPVVVAYAKLREAEARLPSPTQRVKGVEALRGAQAIAVALGAQRIQAYVERLAEEFAVSLVVVGITPPR